MGNGEARGSLVFAKTTDTHPLTLLTFLLWDGATASSHPF